MLSYSEDLFEQAISIDNLLKGWHKVSLNKGCAGGDGVTIDKYARNYQKNIEILHHRLASGSYAPLPYRKIKMTKPSGNLRLLNVPSVADRIIQTSVALILNPIFEAEFENSSHGYRTGKSVVTAVAQIEFLRDEGFQYIIEGDIDDYFSNISHDNLLNIIRHYVADENIIALIMLWLTSFSQEGNGLAQGSPLSPLLANLYLDALDEEFSRNNVKIVRFADDFVILCKSKKKSEETLTEVSSFLKNYDLNLNIDKSNITNFDEGFRFLGYLFIKSLALKSKQNEVLENAPKLDKPIDYITSEELTNLPEEEEIYLKHRILALLQEGLFLDADENNFTVCDKNIEQTLLIVPANMILRVEISNKATISNQAMHLAMENDLPIDFIGSYNISSGSLIPKIESDSTDSKLHLMQAEHVLNQEKRFALAQIIVEGKIFNQRIVLKRLNRSAKSKNVNNICDKIKGYYKKLQILEGNNINQLLGYEGKVSALYFKALSYLIKNPEWNFTGRGDKLNPTHGGAVIINILSSFVARDIKAILSRSNLHAGFACLHSSANVPNALIYDLMEEFRPLLIEGLMVYLMNSNIIKPDEFIKSNSGKITLRKGVYKELIVQYEKRVNKEITTNNGYVVTWRGLMKKQITQIAKHFKCEATYQPYKSDY